MNLSLSNTLGKRMAINPDGLSLDLAFAADKTLTARKGPTPTFTRASTATFVGSNGLIQSAAINEARFDHDPVTLDCKGLLIEEARTNLVPRSSNFPAGSWSINAGRLTMALNATGPDGTLSATTLTATGLSGAAFIVNSVPLIIGTAFTHSAILKAGTSSFAAISSFDGALDYGAMFNLTTGTFVGLRTDGTLGTVTATSIINLGNGFFRCSMTYVSTGTSNSFTNQIHVSQAGNLNFGTSCTVGTSIIAFAYQLEAGAFPTSYIPTTTAALTRSADVCSITGANFTSFYNQSEGTVSVNSSTPASGNRTIIGIDNNTANEMIRIRTEGTDPFYKVTDGGSDLVSMDLGTIVASTAFKVASCYKINDFATSLNGASALTDNNGTIPTVDRLRIGQDQVGNTISGHISRLRYFKKRLPNTKLQTLTT